MIQTKLFTSLPLALFLTTAPFFTQAQTKRNLRDLSPASSTCLVNRYGECGSDCNSDCDCLDGLVCYNREPGGGPYFSHGGRRDLTIPGCPNAQPGDYLNDYCIDPKKFPVKTLWYVGSKDKPSLVYPLKECWGDCYTDSDWYVTRTDSDGTQKHAHTTNTSVSLSLCLSLCLSHSLLVY
jgi:hypothetical protein